MKVDSNRLKSNIHWVCNDCGKEALKLPENKCKKPHSISTYHTNTCDVCRVRKAVTATRDFGYPVFEIKRRVQK